MGVKKLENARGPAGMTYHGGPEKMESTNRVKIHVCGSDYIIATPEKEEYVKELAYQIDNQAQAMMESNPNMSILTALILCSLSYLDDCNKANANADNMRRQLKDYLEDAAKARIEVDETKRELERLQKEVASYKRQLKAAGRMSPEV